MRPKMNCEAARRGMLLQFYDEIDEVDRREVEAHLAGCAPCRVAKAEERRLQAILSQRPAPEPSDDLLSRCRSDLSRAIDRESAPVRSRFARMLGVLWNRPRLSPAFAALLLVVGFLAGWSVAKPGTGPGVAPGREAAILEAPGSEVASVEVLSADPATGRVRLSYDTMRRTSIEGSAADPEIRRLLVDTVRNSSNAGHRLDAMEALRRYVAEDDVRNALLHAVEDDLNAGARIKALMALDSRTASDPEVRGAFMRRLLRDRNPGVRVRAIESLVRARDPQTVPLMRRLAQEDSDPYIRMRSNAFVEEMFARNRE